MARTKKRSKIFETRYFGIIIGVIVVLLFYVIGRFTRLTDNLDLKMLDLQFNYKTLFLKETIAEGVSLETRNPNINPDILIVGIDFKSLSDFGKWPFPRYREADLVNSFSRIQRQEERERALFLDIFFIEPDAKGFDDANLLQSIRSNGRVFLETVLDELPPSEGAEEFFRRQKILYETYGEITDVSGPWEHMRGFYGLQPPLQPYGRATYGYGHANFYEDADKVFRRQALIAKSCELLETVRFNDLTTDYSVSAERFERLEWVDRNGLPHTIESPLTAEILQKLQADLEAHAPLKEEDTDGDGKPDQSYYLIRKYQDHFLPSITLSLALEYWNKKLSDIVVRLGESILISNPQQWNMETQSWEPYRLETKPAVIDAEGHVTTEAEYQILTEVAIPIDDQGRMLINYMGPPSFASSEGRQTFPIRSFSGYAANPPGSNPASWPRTKAVGNKILMVGPFAQGMAADQKPTPLGLMYGVEIHANALNTILMNKFLITAPWWLDLAILAGLVLLTAFMVSRLSTIWAFFVSLFLVIVLFFTTSIIFDQKAFIIGFADPAIGVILTLITVVVYRALTEEKDKRQIKDMFGKYVSPSVVAEMMETPPELGGVDKNLTVFFSDIAGFTTLSETMTPQELVSHLNKYLTAMTDIILTFKGTLDKYIGDAVMCFWGAPLPQEDHALLACKCSLRQQMALKELNEQWPEEKRISVRMGLNSGIMTVGNMGSTGRMAYTLSGDNVNLGSRLEGLNKQYGTHIMMSEYTYGLVKDKVIARELDNVRVKGKNKPVVVYELIDVPEGLEPPESRDKKKKG